MRSRYPTWSRDHLGDIEQYANDVLTGKRPANRFERLAVERESRDLARIGDPDWPYYFDSEAALKVIRFVETFSHVKGKWGTARGHDALIALSPWQKWNIAQIYGWRRRENGLRRFTSATILVPRKNGKSTMVAPLALYHLAADGEYGAEVYCGATSQKQANEVFLPAKKMAAKQPLFRRRFGIEMHAQWLEKLADGSKFERLIGNPGDGGSPSCYILDEYHEHDTNDQRDTMVTGMGAREQPLELIISTAGSNWHGPCGQHQAECQEILESTRVDETVFAMIYTIDPDDRWDTMDAVAKANPNLGVSVVPERIKEALDQAKQSPHKQNKFKTKHLNLWVGARESWLNMNHWEAAADPSLSLDDFIDIEAAKGIDLSEVDDLTADVNCFACEREGVTHYYLFARTYATQAKCDENPLYQTWADTGHLQICDGDAIDYDEVERGVTSDHERFQIKGLFFDPAGAAVMAQRINTATGIEPFKVAQNFTNFTPAMREFEALLRQGRIHHNGDPVLTWCMGNVIAKESMDGKYKRPVKEHKANKIDTAVAALLAFIGAWTPDEDAGDLDGFISAPIMVSA